VFHLFGVLLLESIVVALGLSEVVTKLREVSRALGLTVLVLSRSLIEPCLKVLVLALPLEELLALLLSLLIEVLDLELKFLLDVLHRVKVVALLVLDLSR